MKIVERDVNDLIEAEYNPRQMTADQRSALLDSLKRFGMVDPVIVNKHKDRKDIVIGGHQRLRIWKSLGKEKIPTVEVKLDRDKERELNIRLNKNVGEWDWDALANEFDIGELEGFGFPGDELGAFDVEGIEPPDLPDGDREPFRQATFTLHDEQWETIEAALGHAKGEGHGESTLNENSNGNALAWIAEEYNRGQS